MTDPFPELSSACRISYTVGRTAKPLSLRFEGLPSLVLLEYGGMVDYEQVYDKAG